jgi:hypothetical protein
MGQTRVVAIWIDNDADGNLDDAVVDVDFASDGVNLAYDNSL